MNLVLQAKTLRRPLACVYSLLILCPRLKMGSWEEASVFAHVRVCLCLDEKLYPCVSIYLQIYNLRPSIARM